jgi:hypothetical protein
MAIEKRIKDARGYERTGFARFHELSQGVRPTLAEAAKPASFLPVKLKDEYFNEWWVLLAGTIVSIERTIGSVNRIVPAIGAAAQNIVYGANDINYTVDVDTIVAGDPTLVAAAGTAVQQLPANKPIGWAWHHYYSASIEERLINYEIQPFVSILCDYEIEIPLLGEENGIDQSFVAGDLVKPSVSGSEYGVPEKWVNGVDSAELICGRILFRDTIPTGVNSRSRIDLQKPVKGLGLTGVENDGVPRHLDEYLYGSTTSKATEFARINLALL